MRGADRAIVAELEGELRALGPVIDFPPTPELATAVRAGLATAPPPRLRVVRIARPVLLAAAILVLLAGAAVAWVVVRGLVIEPVDTLPSIPPATAAGPSASAGPGSPGAGLWMGEPVPLDEIAGRAGFAPRIPAGPLPGGGVIGPPDAAYVAGGAGAARVALAWAPRPGLPAVGGTGVGLLVEELRGATNDVLVRKLVAAGTTVSIVPLADGTPAYWIAEGPHGVLYEAPGGRIEEVPVRLAGETLVFNRGDLLVRIEMAAGLETARAIADALP